MNKKGMGVFDNFGGMAIGVAALCITLVVAFLIMATAQSTMRADGSACSPGYSLNITGTGCCITGETAATCSLLGAGTNWSNYNSTAYTSTGTLQTATEGIPAWVSIIIITAIGAALIGMVTMFRR